ncbi:MAG: 4-hydroxybenzoate polyprenyltransferase [Patescibacteria group bacterium]|jgi:4-hydroxybenzoate polyprenyltransferase
MRYWLQLIRWPNLIIVALTMYVLQFKVLLTPFENSQLVNSISLFNFHLLVLMTLLATASGYIVNDWFDYKIDLVNKPNKVIINKKITWRIAKLFYLFLIIIGAFISSYLSSKTGLWGITILYNTVCILLFLYARFFKRTFLIGNIVVSMLCGFVPLLVWYVNRIAITTLGSDKDLLAISYLLKVFITYLAFSVFITLFREIVKDIQDIEGDKKYLAKTLPIVSGIKTAKFIAGIAAVSILLGLCSLGTELYLRTGLHNSLIIGIALFFLQAWSILLLIQATKKEHFRKLSSVLKACMFLGLVWLILL